jgi:hypothetical protein
MTTITAARAAVDGIRAIRTKPVGVRPIQKYRGNVTAGLGSPFPGLQERGFCFVFGSHR